MAAMIPEALQARFGGVEREWLDSAFEPVVEAGGFVRWLVDNGGNSASIDLLRSRLIAR